MSPRHTPRHRAPSRERDSRRVNRTQPLVRVRNAQEPCVPTCPLTPYMMLTIPQSKAK